MSEYRESHRPTHGPYGELWFDDRPEEQRWKVRLTEDGKRFVEEKLAECGDRPIKLLWKAHRAFARYVIAIDGKEAVNQHCRVGYAIAATKYDPAKGEFSTIASQYLRRTCQLCVEDPRSWKTINCMRSRNHRGARSGVCFVRGFLDDKEKFTSIEEAKILPESVNWESDKLVMKHKVDGWLDKVPKRQAHIVREYIMGERSLESIGNELGITKERVRQIVNATKQKLGYVITPTEYQKVVGE